MEGYILCRRTGVYFRLSHPHRLWRLSSFLQDWHQKSEDSLPANESVGSRAIPYAGVCLGGLIPYTYKQSEFYRSFVEFTWAESTFSVYRDIMFVPYLFTNIFKVKTFYFENFLSEIFKLIRLFIVNEKKLNNYKLL
jgi:hypothetical protein